MDVIAAIATGSAATAIGIVRVSGDGCFALCGRVFRAAGGRPFAAQEPRKMVFGEMLDRAGRVIDRGLAVRFPGPGSYTGEDCAEFHCHGSPVVLRELLSALFAAGARQAQAGEFTKRAFLNGRMDLTQAEAVVDLIDAAPAAAASNAAAQLAGAHDFITRLPQGYDTPLSGNGASLSQGQRQLLCIARVMLCAPPMLILDEATSSIDTRTEKLVQDGMDKLMHGRTTFVIAHRLSTVRNSDCIMVLENGRIIERGTHDQLIEEKGKYYQLYTGNTGELA